MHKQQILSPNTYQICVILQVNQHIGVWLTKTQQEKLAGRMERILKLMAVHWALNL